MMGSIGAKLHLKTFDEAMHADWEVDAIEISSTTLMLRGYLVRAEDVRTWSRVDAFAAEGLDRQCGGLLYDLDEHDEDGSWCIPLRSHGLSVERHSVGGTPWLAGLVVQALDTSNARWRRCGLFDIKISGLSHISSIQ
jgi:hypothetical protein